MAAKKPVKKAAAKAPAKKVSAPAKKVSAPAKKAAKKPSTDDSWSPGSGYADIDDQIRAVWAKRGNKGLFDVRDMSAASRSRDSYDFREINRLYDRAAYRDRMAKTAKLGRSTSGGSAPAQRGGNLGSFLRGGGLRRGGR